MTNPTNRQMAAAFKKIGFHKCRLQMTRMGHTYTYKETGAMFTFPKNHKEKFQITAPGHDGWSCIILSEEKWQSLQENPYIDWDAFNIDPGAMSALLCIARGFARFIDESETIAASQAS
jgi:hypothetical protein